MGICEEIVRKLLEKDRSEQITKLDLLKLRYDYAWNWFNYHANQRVSMFNYFLIITGILANAYVGILKEGLLEIAAGLGGLGLFTTIGFFFLDCRNKQLVGMGEDVLEKLEREEIFTENFRTTKNEKEIQLGFLFREAKEEPKWELNRKGYLWANIKKHKVWIRSIEVAVAVCFFLATVLPLVYPEVVRTHSSFPDKIKTIPPSKTLDPTPTAPPKEVSPLKPIPPAKK